MLNGFNQNENASAEEANEQLYKVISTQFLPSLVEQAIHGTGPEQQAALNTCMVFSTVTAESPDVFVLSPSLLVRAYENQLARGYLHERFGLESSRLDWVINSGAGQRVNEYFASLIVNGDQVLAPYRLLLSEPSAALRISELRAIYEAYLPGFTTVGEDFNLRRAKSGLYLADLDHSQISQLFSGKTIVDEMNIFRLDPALGESVIDKEHTISHVITELIKLIKLLSPNGHATITIGTGNNEDEMILRYETISRLSGILSSLGLKSLVISNPASKVLGYNKYPQESDEQVILSTEASEQILLIPGNQDLSVLAQV
jgi:hypothetical protein